MKKQWFTILLVCGLLLSCEKDKETADPNETGVFGTWTWTYTCGGWGDCETPASTGNTGELRFLKDSTYTWIKNGELFKSGNFQLYKGKSIIFADTVFYISLQGIALPQVIDQYGNDSLLLAGDCYDCGSSLYIRKK